MITYNLEYFNKLNMLLSYGFENIDECEILKVNLLNSIKAKNKTLGSIYYSDDELLALFYKSRSCVYPLDRIKEMDKKDFHLKVLAIIKKKEVELDANDLIFLIKQL